MPNDLVISLDAMGGDNAPEMIIRGASIARVRMPEVHYLIVGDEARIAPLLEKDPELAAVSSIRHTEELISSGEKPAVALRSGRNSSMRLAINAVADGEAASVVSAGNTGALMAIAKFVLKTLPGIDRPAITAFYPTRNGEACMLDLGANLQCDAKNLVQFAVMGEVFARTVLGIGTPTIGLLNVGVEELKGHEEIREASAILRSTDLPGEFVGFVEGDDIAAGTVDVVVTDGFTGNVALKTAEGMIKLYAGFLKDAFQGSLIARLGYLLAKREITNLRARTDPRRYNGAMLLGLNGIVVKSHGGTDGFGFASAIEVAADMATHQFLQKITDDIDLLGEDYAQAGKKAAN